MNQTGIAFVVLGFIFLVAADASSAEEFEIPDAPQEYLDMENLVDEDDVDEDFLKKVHRLYKSKCRKCHGTEGDGKGSASEDIEIKPTALNAPGYLEGREDGQLFWVIMYGVEGTEMEGLGPESSAGLSEEKIWQLISYMRAKFTR